ncbi:hypothetical protein IJG29_04540 [Candidatus Saccharibacteria bacterium]|nr:hypothetical protein [Candidatus Saccharibacteria bacterium]
MYNQGEIASKERRKVIIFAAATAAVILALIVAIIVVAMNKANRSTNLGGSDNTSFTLDETKPSDSTKKDESKASTVGTVTTKTTNVSPVSEASDLPSTGPADLLPAAALLGGLTTAGTAFALKKRA